MSLLRQMFRVQVICPSTGSIGSRSCSSSHVMKPLLTGQGQGTLPTCLGPLDKRYQSTLYQTATATTIGGTSGYKDIPFSTGDSDIREPTATRERDDHVKTENVQYPGQTQGHQGQDHQTDDGAGDAATEDEQRFKDDLLELALGHVKTVGWCTEAIARAASEAGLSPAVGSMFKDVDLVYYFISKNNEGLEKYLAEQRQNADGGGGTVPNLRQALEWRLQKVVPFAPTYSEAIALISRPEHVSKSVGYLMDIADTIAHHSLKDSSTDLNWYSKRMAIAGIFVSSELCLVQDKSEGYSETWKFLERRCQEFDKYGKGQLNLTSVPLTDLLHVGFTTVMNLVGRNAPR